MRLPRNRMDALVPARDPAEQRVPYPSPPDVLYDPPNPDGSRKSCASCYKFVVDGACIEVDGPVLPTQVCGLYVHGVPVALTAAQLPPAAPMRKVAPLAAGLVDTPRGEGSSCDTCRFFTRVLELGEGGGLCGAVAGGPDGRPPVAVDALGCCSRWQVDPSVLAEP